MTFVLGKRLKYELHLWLIQIEHKNNPLVEVLKSMINHTFKDEKVVTEIKYNVSVKLVILFSICASLSFLFIALSFVYCMDKPAEDKRNGQDLANTKRKKDEAK